jgi:DNA-binding transcriptional LysR family regulator
VEMHQVRYFLAVCQTLNFTRAAEECHVSQPALSRAIRQLEAELGGELLRRERSLTQITDLGRAVLPSLRQCYEGRLAARSLAQSYLKEGHAPLRLALSRSIEMELLAPLLGEITRAFPRMEIKISRGPPHEIAEKLKSGEAEIAVAGPLGDDWERFDARRLYEERFGVLLNQHHEFATKNSITLDVLLDECLLCRPHCGPTETLLVRLKSLRTQAISQHEVPLVDDLIGLVRADFGVGVLPTSRRLPDDLCFREIEGIDLTRWIQVYSVAGRQQSTAASTLKSLLRAKDWSATAHSDRRTEESPQ